MQDPSIHDVDESVDEFVLVKFFLEVSPLFFIERFFND